MIDLGFVRVHSDITGGHDKKEERNRRGLKLTFSKEDCALVVYVTKKNLALSGEDEGLIMLWHSGRC